MNESFNNNLKKPSNKKSKNHKINKKYAQIVISMLILLTTIIVSMLVSYNLSTKSYKHLKGLWDYDTVTMYEFDEKGNGTLVLPTKKYNFTYTADEDTITIDFEDEKAYEIVDGILESEGSYIRAIDRKI